MPKLTVLEKTIQALDEKIAALQLAKQHLVEQQKIKAPKKAIMRAVSGSD